MQGQPFVKNGITLLSGVDPVLRAEKTADAAAVRDKTLYFCPSPLYGYGLSRLLSRLEKEAPCSAVLCVEADPELYELCARGIDAGLLENKRLRLINAANAAPAENEAARIIAFIRDTWGAMAFSRVETLRFSGGWQLYKEFYNSIFNLLRAEIANDWSNVLTLSKMGRLYIRNAVRNLGLLTQFPSIAGLSLGASNVLVLGAGPSLDETLDAVSCNFPQADKKSFKIICVDTALGSLRDRGISPDLVVILESQHWNLRDFIGCSGWNVPAAVDLCSLPASANLLGSGFIFMTPWASLKIFDRLKEKLFLPESVPPLGSVGLTAVEIARRVSRGNIICAGLDFSFTQDKYHARSTPGHRSALNRQNRFKRISNSAAYDSRSFAALSKSGLPVYSNPIMRKYRDLFEQEFGGDSRIFDIEGTGLPLGIKTLSMKEAIAILNNKNFYREIEALTAQHPVQVHEVRGKNNELEIFFENELERLGVLRDIFTGKTEADEKRLYNLLDECDYLWAHFPDYAGGRSPQPRDISFLKRARAELDPMMELIKRAMGD